MAYLSQLRATGSVEEPVEKWNRVTSCLGLSHDQQVHPSSRAALHCLHECPV